MYLKKIKKVIRFFTKHRIAMKRGMTEEAITLAEEFYMIKFPPDLRKLLKHVLPVTGGFYDWGDYSKSNVEHIRRKLYWPIEGALFDVEHNNFWLKSWGKKPEDMSERLEIAKTNMEKAPQLIPVCGHRYISSLPNEAGNPVYSVYQMDIVFYGEDIWSYFDIEFGEKGHDGIDMSKIKPIPFWHEILINIENIVE